MSARITIAMATFNGARHLRTQLDSIRAQTVPDWRLLVSDDGSVDGTRQLLDDFARTCPAEQMTIIDGPKRGATANFLHLIAHADSDGWIAFCDQDDVWQPEKLALAARWLAERSGAAVYAARTTICDEDLQPLAPAPHFQGPFGFRNALVQACLPGNTTVANTKALALLKQAVPAAQDAGIISHDWWVYQLLSGAGAEIFRDSAQVVLYRQHARNVMGRNDTPRARAARASMLFDGTYAKWLAQNQHALTPVSGLLTPENRALLRRFGQLQTMSGPRAAAEMIAMRLYRQTRPATAALLAAALAGRLRQTDSRDLAQ